MMYTCQFEHRYTHERKSVICALSAAEVACVEALSEDADLMAMAMALRSAYRAVAAEFLHIEPPRLIRPS